MNKSLFLAACFAAGAGAAAVGATTFATQPYLGSDTEYNITNEAILQAGLGNTSLPLGTGTWDPKTNPIGDYAGGGSGGGEGAMVGGKQFTAPMSRMMKGGSGKNACAAAQATLMNGSGIVTGIDAARVYASNVVMGATATCNGPAGTPCTSDNSGLTSNAGPGATAIGFRNWRDVLAMLYGGMDRTATGGRCSNSFSTVCDPQGSNTCGTGNTCNPVVDCNSSNRKNLVNHWSYLFQNTCTNSFSSNVNQSATTGFCPDGSTCNPSDAQPSCPDGITPCAGVGTGLTHAFRRDDLSGTADVFSNLILLQGTAAFDAAGNSIAAITISGGGVNGFGVSPYCNALNWDFSEASAAGLCDDGVTPCKAGGLCADNTYCIVQCANAVSKHYVGPGGLPVPAATEPTQQHHIPPVVCSGAGTDWRCGGAATVTAAVWGYAQGVALQTTVAQPQVAVTSYQDNDPIRTPCLGAGIANRPGEDVCNDDGALGVVIPIPALDFIKNVPGGVQEFPSLACNGPSQQTNTPNIFKCAPGNAKFANGLCPNNDGGACFVPTNKTGSAVTTQCQATKQTSVPCQKGHCAGDGRVFNLHSITVPTSGNASWTTYSVAEIGPAAVVPFMGAFGRIHERETSQNLCKGAGASNGNPCVQAGSTCADGTSICTAVLTACQLDDATDLIGCLAQADPNSIGFGGNTGDSWEGRSTIPLVAGETAPTTVGLRVNGLGAGASCTPTVATDGSGKYVANPTANYPLWRKLYFNSLKGFGTVNALSGTTNPNAPAEINLAEWESVAANISPVMSFYGFFTLPQSPLGQDGTSGTVTQCNPPGSMNCYSATPPSGGFYKPFCEDFNEYKNCGYTGSTKTGGTTCDETTGNCNGCNNNVGVTSSFGTVPSDVSADPTAATTSTVCGNGVLEFFEDCDYNLPSSIPAGTSCSAGCRLSGGIF